MDPIPSGVSFSAEFRVRLRRTVLELPAVGNSSEYGLMHDDQNSKQMSAWKSCFLNIATSTDVAFLFFLHLV